MTSSPATRITSIPFLGYVVEEAALDANYTSERMTVRFLTDESCIYQSDNMDRLTCAVRGTAEVKFKVSPLELTGAETVLLCRLGYTQLYQGQTMYADIDVHMNTQPSYLVNINTIVPLEIIK